MSNNTKLSTIVQDLANTTDSTKGSALIAFGSTTVQSAITTANTNVAANATSIGTLNTSVGTLNTNVGTNTSNISSLTTTVSGHTTSIGTLTTNVGTNTSNISSLTTTVSGHTTSIGTLTTNVGTNTTNLSSLTTTVGTNTSNISSLTTTVSGNTTSIGTLTTNLGTTNTNLTTLSNSYAAFPANATITGGTINGVAIGGTTPAVGTFTSISATTGQILGPVGTAALPGIAATSYPGTGLYFNSSVNFSVNGVQVAYLNGSSFTGGDIVQDLGIPTRRWRSIFMGGSIIISPYVFTGYGTIGIGANYPNSWGISNGTTDITPLVNAGTYDGEQRCLTNIGTVPVTFSIATSYGSTMVVPVKGSIEVRWSATLSLWVIVNSQSVIGATNSILTSNGTNSLPSYSTAINGVTIGATTATTGSFTTLTSTGGAFNGTVGATTPSTGTFTTLVSTAGTINGTSVGATTKSTGAFTTLTSTGGAFNGTVGATTPSTGTFTTLVSTAGTINGTSVGATTPSTGGFTTLNSTGGALNGTIGATTPAAGSFTAVTTSALYLSSQVVTATTVTVAPTSPVMTICNATAAVALTLSNGTTNNDEKWINNEGATAVTVTYTARTGAGATKSIAQDNTVKFVWITALAYWIVA